MLIKLFFYYLTSLFRLFFLNLESDLNNYKKNMVNIYNYQVWSSVNNGCYTSADASYIATIRQPLSLAQGFFYILINLLLTKNMYYENNLRQKS